MKTLLVLSLIVLSTACLRDNQNIPDLSLHEWSDTSFESLNLQFQVDGKQLFSFNLGIRKSLFDSVRSPKFQINKYSYCDGIISSNMYLFLDQGDSAWSGKLNIQIAGFKSRIISKEIQDTMSGNRQMYYGERVEKNGSLISLTFKIVVVRDSRRKGIEISLVKIPEGRQMLLNDRLVIGSLDNLFVDNKKSTEISMVFNP